MEDEFNFNREELGTIVEKARKQGSKDTRISVDRELAKLFGAKEPYLHNAWVGIIGEYFTLPQIGKILSDNKIGFKAEDFVKAMLLYELGRDGPNYYFFSSIHDEFGSNGIYRLMFYRSMPKKSLEPVSLESYLKG